MRLQVVTPVGPGHEDTVYRALQSVQIACRMGMGPFTNVKNLVVNDKDGALGRSAARNEAVREADADWLFFLDADDMMHPSALESVRPFVNMHDAVWGTIMEYSAGCMVERYQVPEIETREHLIAHDPYLTIQMGHYVRAEVAKATPFNENMDTGEDWDYYLRLWRTRECRKVRAPFMLNVRGEHSVGPRSATGQDWMRVVHGMLEREREAMERVQNLHAIAGGRE